MIVNEFHTREEGTLALGQDAEGINIRVWIGLLFLKGLCPSRAEGIAGFAVSPTGVSPSFPRIKSGVHDGPGGSP